jgi:hypothetical protein
MIFVNGTTLKFEFNEDMDFHDFQRLTQQFTADAVDLARTLSSQQCPTEGCECHDCDFLLVRQKKSRWRPELSSLKHHANLFA